MITPESVAFIKAMLQSTLDGLIATQSHLNHQLGLPTEHRIAEVPEAEMDQNLREVESLVYKTEKALVEFKLDHI